MFPGIIAMGCDSNLLGIHTDFAGEFLAQIQSSVDKDVMAQELSDMLQLFNRSIVLTKLMLNASLSADKVVTEKKQEQEFLKKKYQNALAND